MIIEEALLSLRQPLSFRSSGNAVLTRLHQEKVVMPLGLSGQRGVYEVCTSIYDVSQSHFASHNILRFYAKDPRSIIDAIYFKSAFIEKYWAYFSASLLKEVATFSCLGPFLALPRVDWGC